MSEISRLLKLTFLIDVIFCSLVGAILLIMPTIMFSDPFAGNMMGGVFLSFVLINLLALRESEMEDVKFIMITDIASNTIVSCIFIIGFFIYNLPAVSWVFIGGANSFSISYIYCWIQGRE